MAALPDELKQNFENLDVNIILERPTLMKRPISKRKKIDLGISSEVINDLSRCK